MNTKVEKRTSARLLIALLAIALVFAMMPLSMGKVFAVEDSTVEGLTVTGDVANELTFDGMKSMKNDTAVKPLSKSDVAFHAINKKGTETNVTVKGITIEDLIGIAELKTNAKLIGITATSGADGYVVEYSADIINNLDVTGTNKPMFCWGMTEGETDYKVQYVVRGQTSEEDTNNSDWTNNVNLITVKALDQPVIKVTPGKAKATIKWAADPDAEQYVIMRATKKAGKYAKVGTAKAGVVKYVDKKAKKGKTYFYKVKAVAGDLDNLSAPKKAKIK